MLDYDASVLVRRVRETVADPQMDDLDRVLKLGKQPAPRT
jgi:hypothetical protein